MQWGLSEELDAMIKLKVIFIVYIFSRLFKKRENIYNTNILLKYISN